MLEILSNPESFLVGLSLLWLGVIAVVGSIVGSLIWAVFMKFSYMKIASNYEPSFMVLFLLTMLFTVITTLLYYGAGFVASFLPEESVIISILNVSVFIISVIVASIIYGGYIEGYDPSIFRGFCLYLLAFIYYMVFSIVLVLIIFLLALIF